MHILVTGATGKVGQNFIAKALAGALPPDARIRALCHHRTIPETERISVIRGSIASRETAAAAMLDISHVVHLATCKETPEDVMDVTVKGLFWLLEEARTSSTLRQFILIGGDAAVGHFHVPHHVPYSEDVPFHPYPGCYALSKVLEEVMLQQYYAQYDLPGCCLRAPWIMEKDDFRYTLSFGDDVFGGPVWKDLVPREDAERYRKAGTVPCLHDVTGRPLKRDFVHVTDLVAAILAAIDQPRAHQQTFNIAMSRPVDYGEVAEHLRKTRGLDSVPIESGFHSNWMNNNKARFLLDWEPQYDLRRLIDEAWSFERPADEPRKIWYPG